LGVELRGLDAAIALEHAVAGVSAVRDFETTMTSVSRAGAKPFKT